MSHVDLGRLFPTRRPRLAGARWLLGAALLAALLGAFWASGAFDRARPPGEGSFGAALFFSAIIAYVVPIFGYIAERTRAALDALTGVIDAPPQQLGYWRTRVDRKPRRWLLIVLALGSILGIAHNVLLYRSPGALVDVGFGSTPAIAIVMGTMLTWIVVTLVVAGLLDNAIMMARAGRRCRVNLLDTHALRPFASVAVISTLALIGAQAAFPIMGVDDSMDPAAYIPGLLGTGVPMLLLAALPIYPVHQRIAAARRQALRDVSARIAALPPAAAGVPDNLDTLAPLLTYRRELLAVSEWPFDIGVVTRLALYLIIPPLTWIGAALIENAVDSLL